MKISLSSFVYFNFTLEDAIRRTAEAGYDGIDIWGGRPHAYRRDLSKEDIAHLRTLLNDANLAVASFIPAQFRYPTCLCSSNEVVRRDSVAYIQDSIETAAGLGAPIVSVCPGHSIHGQGKDDARARLTESLLAICEFAAQFDLRIAIEPADHYETDLINTTEDAMRLIEELGQPNLGVLVDNGHAHVVGEPAADAVRTAGDRLFHLHIDDNNGLRDQHLIPGEGTCDIAGFLATLKDIAYEEFLCAELGWDYTIDPDPAARLAAQRLRKFLKVQ
jgi:protein FrlC